MYLDAREVTPLQAERSFRDAPSTSGAHLRRGYLQVAFLFCLTPLVKLVMCHPAELLLIE